MNEPAWETMLPVAVHVPVAGSYSSAEARAVVPLRPPTASTLPSSSATAAKSDRGVVMLPVAAHDGARGGTGAGVAVGAGEDEIVGPGVSAAGDGGWTAARDGAGSGGTSGVSRSTPDARRNRAADEQQRGGREEREPAATAEPPRALRHRPRDRHDIAPQRQRRGLAFADPGAVERPQALLELSVRHRWVPLLSPASIASCSRLSA